MTTYTDVEEDDDEVYLDLPQEAGLSFNVAANSQNLILGAI